MPRSRICIVALIIAPIVAKADLILYDVDFSLAENSNNFGIGDA